MIDTDFREAQAVEPNAAKSVALRVFMLQVDQHSMLAYTKGTNAICYHQQIPNTLQHAQHSLTLCHWGSNCRSSHEHSRQQKAIRACTVLLYTLMFVKPFPG